MSAERRQSADRKFWFIGVEVLGGREGGVGHFHGIDAPRMVAARERAAQTLPNVARSWPMDVFYVQWPGVASNGR